VVVVEVPLAGGVSTETTPEEAPIEMPGLELDQVPPLFPLDVKVGEVVEAFQLKPVEGLIVPALRTVTVMGNEDSERSAPQLATR
jgi:hypothetical protein